MGEADPPLRDGVYGVFAFLFGESGAHRRHRGGCLRRQRRVLSLHLSHRLPARRKSSLQSYQHILLFISLLFDK